MISGLARGDRVPDFQRPNAAGKTVMLYDLQVGQPLVLLMIETRSRRTRVPHLRPWRTTPPGRR